MKGLSRNFNEFLSDIDRHNIFIFSSALAYTTALALAPFVLMLLSFSSFLSAELQSKLYEQLVSSFGSQVGKTIQIIIEKNSEAPKTSGFSGIIGVLVLAFSASVIFYQLRLALDRINEYKPKESQSGVWSFLKDRLFSIGLVFGFAFLSIVSLMISIGLNLAFGPGGVWYINLLSLVGNFLIFSILFTAIYRYVPSSTLSFKTCLISGVVSTVFFLIGKSLIGIYIANAGFESSYGAAGSLVVFLVWVYYIALVLLTSYEFSKNIILSKQ